MKKLEIEKTKPTFIISVLKVDIIKAGLVFLISNFFITKTSLANKWMRKKYLLAVIHLYLQKAMDEKFATQAQIENDTRAYKLQCAKFDEEVNTAKAQAQLAYELEVAKVQQKIRTEQIKIDVVVRKKQIEIEEEEMKRKEKELIGTVRLPAEAEAFK